MSDELTPELRAMLDASDQATWANVSMVSDHEVYALCAGAVKAMFRKLAEALRDGRDLAEASALIASQCVDLEAERDKIKAERADANRAVLNLSHDFKHLRAAAEATVAGTVGRGPTLEKALLDIEQARSKSQASKNG